jgi:hypothetical protein
MIDRPVFVLGNIRSGTTILYNLLAVHPDLCWFSNFSDRYWRHGAVPLLHRALDLPVVGPRIRRAIAANRRPAYPVPWPREGDAIYHVAAGFGRARDGIEAELSDVSAMRLRAVIADHLRWTARPRFLSKQTANNRRVALLEQMFPDACYVHVIRDGRAVANSTLRVAWWPDMHLWWLGRSVRDWQADGGIPVVLAAMNWQETVREVRRHAVTLGGRYLEVRYEDLLADTPAVIRRVAGHCGLEFGDEYARYLPQRLPDMNRKWREQLSAGDIAAMEEAIGPYLHELGYDPGV